MIVDKRYCLDVINQMEAMTAGSTGGPSRELILSRLNFG